ncbi:Maf1 regulator-domain-containing protein [Protomyces lactucae-debilis]|uniref:Repressor of RNA polymerase III transcription MAF1 n=1 Tax=Protomyces lactucae-debilis TaxID=2754530 RepID=A0A1Y2ESS9_PROLT|nr:Maf1 regulator-domain-containing protein [Protomyces lactucae-debilis]ORY74628.1 Maf1 regulator-domain-containing protein [Protomyces lactucae-debilis]
MKYLEIRDFESINDKLVFNADDCRIVGKCELYTTKAAGSDKKLCKSIERSLEQRYVEDLAKSPNSPSSALSKSPFGPLNLSASRKTFAYIIATMNASHPDHDFSSLRPFDFRNERNLSAVLNALNTTLSMQGQLQTAGLWELIDRHIDLSQCDIYSYAPDADSDPHGGDGLLWSQSYFFFSKEQKRVLYFTVRGCSLRSPPLKARDYESDASDDLDGSKSVVFDMDDFAL